MDKGSTLSELVSAKYQDKESILAPWLTTGELVLLFAPRGTGKTYFALSLAYALSIGKSFLSWQNNRKWSVYYLDGEMGRRNIANRLKQISKQYQDPIENAWMRIFTFQSCENESMWNMSQPEYQSRYNELIHDSDVIIIDNLLSCSQPLTMRDDDLNQWRRIQPWLVKLRAQGKTVIVIHHSGKSGLQLGTSIRENIQDTIVRLTYSELTQPENGQAFELHFEKNRNFYGDAKKPLHIEYTTENANLVWRIKNLDDVKTQAVMLQSRFTSKAHLIADKLGLPLWKVTEILQKQEFETPFMGGDDELF